MKNIQLIRTTSDNADFRTLTSELDADLRDRNGDVMNIYDQHNVIDKIDTVVIAYINDEPAGCGCFKAFDAEAVEIKRMFVRHNARGNGISTLVLRELETWAVELGYQYTVLETASKQLEAHNLYRKFGYVQTENYGVYAGLPDSLCFKKRL